MLPSQAWQWQKDQMKLSADSAEDGTDIDALFMLQHQPVYTLGASSTEANLRFDPSFPPLPLHRTERGGEVTYHGPGQVSEETCLHCCLTQTTSR